MSYDPFEDAVVPDPWWCQRCGSSLSADNLCQDETCPFHKHKQDCANGWAGHPEMDGYSHDDTKRIDCKCKSPQEKSNV